MFPNRKQSGRVFSVTHRRRYEDSYYTCKECNISCTSAKQLEQHLNGVKHQDRVKTGQQKNKALNTDPEERSGSSSRTVDITHAQDSIIPMEHMFILDETDEDMANECAPSCDSSDSEADVSSTGFQTLKISKKHLVVLDETNDDEHPASPASCESSEVVSSSIATVKSFDEQLKKTRKKTDDPNQNAPSSPLSDVSVFSSNSAPEAENVAEESEDLSAQEVYRTKHRKRKDREESPVLKPVTCIQDVFDFLKNFEVANKSDVTFALKIVEMLSKALNKCREDRLEEMLCTEEEDHHVSPKATLPCSPSSLECDNTHSLEQMHSSISQETNSRKFRRSCSRSLSPGQSISYSSSSTCSSITLSSCFSHPNVIPSSSLNDATEVVNSPKKSSITISTDSDIYKSETDLGMEGDYCLTAEAACSDDDDGDA